MKRIKNKFNFVLACVMTGVALFCVGYYLFVERDSRLLAAAFVVAVWAVVDFYDGFHRQPIEERVSSPADERDVYLAMKSSRTAMGIFNKCLFIASVLCFWFYSRWEIAFLLPVAVTLCAAVFFLFVLLLCVNLYYEKRG